MVISNEPDSSGFRAKCVFTSVMETMKTANRGSIEYVAARDSFWTLHFDREGCWHVFKPLRREEYHKRGSAAARFSPPVISFRYRVLLDDEDVVTEWTSVAFPGAANIGRGSYGGTYATWDEYETFCKERSFGFLSWRRFGYSFQQLVTQPLARAHDSLVLEIEVKFLQ